MTAFQLFQWLTSRFINMNPDVQFRPVSSKGNGINNPALSAELKASRPHRLHLQSPKLLVAKRTSASALLLYDSEECRGTVAVRLWISIKRKRTDKCQRPPGLWINRGKNPDGVIGAKTEPLRRSCFMAADGGDRRTCFGSNGRRWINMRVYSWVVKIHSDIKVWLAFKNITFSQLVFLTVNERHWNDNRLKHTVSIELDQTSA